MNSCIFAIYYVKVWWVMLSLLKIHLYNQSIKSCNNRHLLPPLFPSLISLSAFLFIIPMERLKNNSQFENNQGLPQFCRSCFSGPARATLPVPAFGGARPKFSIHEKVLSPSFKSLHKQIIQQNLGLHHSQVRTRREPV